MTRWDPVFDRGCQDLVAALCEAKAEASRTQAWQALITRTGPFIEEWARSSAILRRCRLGDEDEARAILVAVLERMRQHNFQNLKDYLARQPPRMPGDCEETAVDELAQVARLCDADGGDDDRDDARSTPFRGWLLQLTHYAVRDHVRRRLGWGQTARISFGVEPERGRRSTDLAASVRSLDGIALAIFDEPSATLTVEYLSGSLRRDAITRAIEQAGWTVVHAPAPLATKRDLGTDAERLHDIPEQGARPPITDLMAVRRLISEVRAYMGTFPPPMRAALELWLEDRGFAEISSRLSLADPAEARAIVRAGQARLRERFRGHWSSLFGAVA
jgi:hypothetical protein